MPETRPPHILNFGPIRPLPRGQYNPTKVYKYLDIVTTDVGAYICSNILGAPQQFAPPNNDYWDLLVKNGKNAAIQFANDTDYLAGIADKAISAGLIKPKLDTIIELINNLKATGTVYNATRLGGQPPSHYRCADNCAWTCSSGCFGSCSNSCTGSCQAGCTGSCSSCTGTCTGGCSSTCQGSCMTACTAQCRDSSRLDPH